jgi:hypothetical protein
LRRRHARALSAQFDAAYEECFSGRVGIEEWLRGLAADLDQARDALAWSRAAGEVRCMLTIGATMLRALPPSLHAERMALADVCAAGMTEAVPERLQARAWLELSCAWADTQKQRSRKAARHALALARKLDHRVPTVSRCTTPCAVRRVLPPRQAIWERRAGFWQKFIRSKTRLGRRSACFGALKRRRWSRGCGGYNRSFAPVPSPPGAGPRAAAPAGSSWAIWSMQNWQPMTR